MILNSFKYKESGWELTEMSPLGLMNLLVATNATGKTRTIRALQNVTCSLLSKEPFMKTRSFEASLTFCNPEDPQWTMVYYFKMNDGVVEKEQFKVNEISLITRTKTVAKYKSTKINPPSEKLVVQIRRDKEQYPEIEQLMNWVEGVTFVSCSDINPYSIAATGQSVNPYSFSDLVDELSSAEIKSVLTQSKSLGYNIAGLKTVEAVKNIKLVQLKERSVTNEMVDMQLSNGMLRVLYLLCFVAVMKHNKRLSMLIIDDLGEGLDYSRSINLGKVLFNDCTNNRVQLIVSSNDSFLMDIVDIANWQVLRRNGGKVNCINQSNNPELFRKFKMTGLSNFDLFSSDFINNYLNREK